MKKIKGILSSILCSLILVMTMSTPLAYSLNENVIPSENSQAVETVIKSSNGVTVCSAAKKKPKLNKTSATIEKGKTVKLKVNNYSKKIKWSTSDKKVATVNSSGKVTGKKAGSAKITAKLADGKKLTCKIKVKAKETAKGTVVYITKTGSKYHRDGCRYLRQSKIKTTLKEAKDDGYDACSVCY